MLNKLQIDIFFINFASKSQFQTGAGHIHVCTMAATLTFILYFIKPKDGTVYYHT